MQKKEDLIRENIELRSRLELAEKWIRREVQDSISKVQSEQSKKVTRKALSNMFEAEWLDILTRRILDQFDDSLEKSPKYTLERLIDAEIYWNTLQRYPQMDALPIIIAYQKILDAWIEEKMIAWYRMSMKHTKIWQPIHSTDIDISNIIHKWYTLSIGRLYQILSLIRDGVQLSPMTENLLDYWKREIPDTFAILVSDACYLPFSDLIALEVFSRKRHESKVNYSDAKRIREVMIDESSRKSFLELIFSI